MIIGMSLATFTTVHVIISLVAIVSGLIVLFGMFGSKRMSGLTALFLLTTVLTSVTGFMFPIGGFTPALGTGVISMIVLAVALLAIYGKHLAGAWRWIYVATAVAALYLNTFVLVVQSFMKVGPIKALAPTQSEPPFLIAQAAVLLFFIVSGFVAARKFRPA